MPTLNTAERNNHTIGVLMRYYLVVHDSNLEPMEVIEFSSKLKANEAKQRLLKEKKDKRLRSRISIGFGSDMADFFERFKEYRTKNWETLILKFC